MATRAASLSGDEVIPSFEEEWPELARRLERFLAARGVDRWLRADVIQETAARLYPRWETLDHSLPLWNLTATIAVRVVHNHHRKEARIELVPDPVPSHEDDVHLRGLQRAQLDKTRSALQQLNSDQRRVLLAEVGEALVPAGTRNRINVLRLRARANLKEALGPWAPSAIAIRLRHLGARVAQKRFPLDVHMPMVANSLVNVAMAATLGLAGGAGAVLDAADPAQPERARLLSLSELRDVYLDPIASIRRPEPLDLSTTKDRAKKKSEEGSGLVANTRGTAEGLGEWADRRQKEVGDRQREVSNLAEDGRNLAEDGQGLGEDGRDVGEEWVDGRQEEVGDRQEEVSCAVSPENC